MKTFLEYVAEDLLSKFGNNLNNITVVFPNKRASLFLNEALASYSDRPVLAPKYYTISELFSHASDYVVGDRIELVCLLYKVFRQVTLSEETLDRFFAWGEIIINDFDDIDKHLLDASAIFTNVKDLHELDNIPTLDEEQITVLKQFFPEFEGNNTRLKEKFLKLWSKLAEIYIRFHEEMQREGIMYEGALYRNVVEKFDSNELAAGTYVFVGFNHLLTVERRLFKLIKENRKALFYWDYDKYYLSTHEAGNDIRQNLIIFPNALGDDDEIYNNFSKKKNIRVLTSSTDNLQARYVRDWMKEDGYAQAGRKSVVVLADESLLPTVIHSLPEEVEKANITIGYNLSFTDIHLLINRLIADRKYTSAKTLSDKLSFLATSIRNKAEQTFGSRPWLPQEKSQEIILSSPNNALETESLFRTFTLINRLKKLIDDGILDVTETTLQRLLSQLISTTSVPFHGEPLEGVQIMGVLETRNLDFDNVLLLSCNEGIMPKASDTTSFIPYFLRKAYGLTTIDNKASTYSYYFHRLLQRCNNATLLWNKSTEGMHRGEMSRLILQLMVESDHNIQRLALSTGQTAYRSQTDSVKKTDEVIRIMKERFAKTLSPTAITSYLRCQKRFYYNYVLQLKEYEDPEELDQDSRTFGNIFHNAVHQLYKPFIGKEITADDLKGINTPGKITTVVTQCYINEIQNKSKLPADFKFDGLQSIKIEVLTQYVSRLISIDIRLAPFTILALEQEFTEPYQLDGITTNIGGYIDRLDLISIDGKPAIRVVDYKTSASKFDMKLTGIDDIFDPSFIKDHSDYYLQTYLYSSIVKNQRAQPQNLLSSPTGGGREGASSEPPLLPYGGRSGGGFPIYPALLFIQHASMPDYNPILHFKACDIEPIDKYDQKFRHSLRKLINEIFNPDLPFIPVTDTDAGTDSTCTFCPFRTVCRG